MVDKSVLASLESVVLMAERLTEDDRAVIKSLLMESMDVIRWATTDIDKLVYFSNPCIEKLHTTVDKISSL
jgi:hypothetical protein